MRVILAFHGRKQSGKSSAARAVAEEFGATILSITDPLRRMVCRAFDLQPDDLIDAERKERIDPRYGVSPRWLMQRVGDGLRGAFGENVLTRKLVERVLADDWPLFAVDDCRYHHEVSFLRALEERHPCDVASYVIHLDRLDRAPGIDPHSSETEASNIPVDAVDGWIPWSTDKPLTPQILSEIGRLSSGFPSVRRALNLVCLRGGGRRA